VKPNTNLADVGFRLRLHPTYNSNEEMAACKPYLLEQIRLVDPKIILLTGATAVKGYSPSGCQPGFTQTKPTSVS
jgi:uracil-DNA glycosylase